LGELLLGQYRGNSRTQLAEKAMRLAVTALRLDANEPAVRYASRDLRGTGQTRRNR
jgi:hypothetical protein